MSGVRTAILGYGRSGSTMHAGAVEKNPDMEMVAVCDIDSESREKAKDRFGCEVYDDYHRMLVAEDIDLVCVITRSDQHCSMTCDCLEAGVSVLVTKPWAVSEAEARRMVETGRKAKGQLLPWLPARWGCDLRRIRELVGAGEVGRVFLIRRSVSSFGTRNDWQTELTHGGGYLLNWGAHIIDPPVLLADSPVRTAYGRMGKVNNPGDGEDFFHAVLTLEDGTVVQAEYTVAVDCLPGWVVQGDRGTIVVRDTELTLQRVDPAQPKDPTRYSTMVEEGRSESAETLDGSPYGDEHEVYREIVASVRGEKVFSVTPEHAYELSCVFDAVRISASENQVVEVKSLRTVK